MGQQCKKCRDCIDRDNPKGCEKCPVPMVCDVVAEMDREESERLDFIQKQESIAISINVAIKATRANRRKRNQSGIRYY